MGIFHLNAARLEAAPTGERSATRVARVLLTGALSHVVGRNVEDYNGEPEVLMAKPKRIRAAHDQPTLEGELSGFSPAPDTGNVPVLDEIVEARKIAVAKASLALAPRGDAVLFGSQSFFRRAADELWVSTQHGLELSGAVYTRSVGGRPLLVGLTRKASGLPGRVVVDPTWGALLWHTHPGLRGSLAAFSAEDVACAKQSGKPLLVIGFGGLSPDVLSTLSLPLGLRGVLVAGGIKGILALEKLGHLRMGLLRLGVAARVCYPSGRIQPILRAGASPWRHAFDEMSFSVDRTMGAFERNGQAIAKRWLRRVLGGS